MRGRRARFGNFGGRAVRNTRNRKVVVLNRRPRRNVPKRLPTLGYAAGGTSTVVRAFLKTYGLPKDKQTITDIYTFTLSDAFSKMNNFGKVLSSIYTNFQLQRVVFRVVSFLGTNHGGIHAAGIFDDSMGQPGAIELPDLLSRGGSTGSKAWQDLAVEWVPTEPEDFNYRDGTTRELFFVYAMTSATKNTGDDDLFVGTLVADIHVVARTFNPAVPTDCLLSGKCMHAELEKPDENMTEKSDSPAS